MPHSGPPQEEFDRTVSEFIAVTAHKIHTPVAAIMWQSEMLLAGDMGELNERQLVSLKAIQEEVGRLNDFSRALLYVFELEKDLPLIHPQDTDLPALLTRVIHHLDPLIKGKDIRIQCPPYVVASISAYLDPDLAFIVLRTILENAILYSPTGSAVDVRLEEHGGWTHVAIEDRGCGIPGALQHLVFTKFFRAPNAKLLWTEGTGLGLYLAATIAKRTGGDLAFESEEGRGSTFRWRIPKHTVGKQPWEKH
jgi:signal transduction histidine kinase